MTNKDVTVPAVPGEGGVIYDENTLTKVFGALDGFLDSDRIVEAVNAMQNVGILFRERAREVENVNADNARALIEKARIIAGKKATFDDRIILTLADALESALSAVPVEGEVEWQCVMPGLGWGPCGNPECHNPKRFRRAAGPWEVVAP